MAITDWPIQERPRERLLALGAASLADAELLAILLRTGIKGKIAVDLARQLLGRFGSVSGLLDAGSTNLAGTPGLGTAKLAQLQAALELARRALKEEISSRDALSSPRAVRDYLRLALAGREQEVFLVLLLDAQHRVIAHEELFRGTLTQTSVYPREVVKCSLRHNAAAVIFAHNNPSGVAEPSLGRSFAAALRLTARPVSTYNAPLSRGASHGARLPGNGQEAPGGTPRFPRQQQDHTPVLPEPAVPPFLGGKRKALGEAAHFQRGCAHHRQEGHRRGAQRAARARRDLRSGAAAMREKIKLESTAGTGHFYTTTKNKRSTPDKIEMKKYDPRARKHVIYKETKIK